MNTDTLQGRWAEVRTKAQARWDKLTEEDLDAIAGKREELEDTLQDRYDYTKEQVQEEVDEYLEELNGASRRVQESIQEAQRKLEQRRAEAQDAAREKAADYNRRLQAAAANAPGHPDRLVDEYPWLVIVIVMLIGIIVGVLLSPRKG